MSARRRSGVLGSVAAIALFTGCAQPASNGESGLLACRVGNDGEPANGVLLMAQSVPTAEWVPCLEAMPLGWQVGELEAERGSARFWLSSDRHGQQAIEVRLTASCDTSGATQIPSEREGLRRYERVRQVSPLYMGTRFYEFDGGCISLLFRVAGDQRAEPLGVATQGLGVLSREDLRAHVRAESAGRLDLDPPEVEDGAP